MQVMLQANKVGFIMGFLGAIQGSFTTSGSGAIPKNFCIEKHQSGHCYACALEKSILLGFGTKFPRESQLEIHIYFQFTAAILYSCV
jgi:hypothetical protein